MWVVFLIPLSRSKVYKRKSILLWFSTFARPGFPNELLNFDSTSSFKRCFSPTFRKKGSRPFWGFLSSPLKINTGSERSWEDQELGKALCPGGNVEPKRLSPCRWETTCRVVPGFVFFLLKPFLLAGHICGLLKVRLWAQCQKTLSNINHFETDFSPKWSQSWLLLLSRMCQKFLVSVCSLQNM